jgi:hypothetical protein
LKNYIRICNLKPTFTAIDAAVIAISVIFIFSAALLNPKWIWLETPLFFALLTIWAGCSFFSLEKLIKLEPQDQISEEYISKLIKSWNCAKTRDEILTVFEAAGKAGRFEPLVRKLQSKRNEFRGDTGILILKSLASCFNSSHTLVQMTAAIEFTLNVINYDIVQQRIKKVIEELVTESGIEFGNLLLESAEPNLYGGLTNIYKCNLNPAKEILARKCESELLEKNMNVFVIFQENAGAVKFLRRWACGFDNSREKFSNSKTVSLYVSKMLEKNPQLAAELVMAIPTADKSYLKPVCEMNKLKAAIAKIDLSLLSPERRIAVQIFATPEKTKRPISKVSELVLCG